jgi:tRNA-2-methylthio-N6-dimethylallyladenosine synthase
VDRGVKEVTLLGQIVNLYGRHEFGKIDGKSPFVQLLDAVHDVPGLERLRFTSPHPIGYRDDLIEAFTRLPKLMEHVHLPLQSGSNALLKRMHRAYTREQFLRIVEKMRAAREGLAITTDIIVGFPGETDEDFAASKAMVTEADFDNAFVFRYSPRRDTPAATMDGQLPEVVKEARNQELLEVVNANVARKLEACVGGTQEVLCEGPSRHNAERLFGRTRTNKIVVFEGTPRHIGQVLDLRITRASSSTLYGDPAIL